VACPVSISDPPKTYILLPKREREIGKVISNVKQRKQIKNSKLIDIKWVMFSLFLMYSRYRSREEYFSISRGQWEEDFRFRKGKLNIKFM
jgi:hypothetical protein